MVLDGTNVIAADLRHRRQAMVGRARRCHRNACVSMVWTVNERPTISEQGGEW